MIVQCLLVKIKEDGISIPNESDMDDKVNDLCQDISSEDSEYETDFMLDNIAKDLVNQAKIKNIIVSGVAAG